MEVHKAGGGINFTVERTKAASEDELLGLLLGRLRRMLSAGKFIKRLQFKACTANMTESFKTLVCSSAALSFTFRCSISSYLLYFYCWLFFLKLLAILVTIISCTPITADAQTTFLLY